MRAAGVVLAGIVLLAGCGKEERNEAVHLTKILNDKRSDYAKADATEKELVANAQAWCGGIKANGAGRGRELDQNAAVAAELAKSAVAISGELGRVRQAISEQPVKKEFTRDVRNQLIEQLTRRQRTLQDMRALLEKSAPQFQEFRRSKTYAGDTYPGEIGSLDTMLQAYRAPRDSVGTALEALKTKYGLSGKP